YEPLEPLAAAGKLGPVLWQLPETFRRDDERLAETLSLLLPGRHAFEFRHVVELAAGGGVLAHGSNHWSRVAPADPSTAAHRPRLAALTGVESARAGRLPRHGADGIADGAAPECRGVRARRVEPHPREG